MAILDTRTLEGSPGMVKEIEMSAVGLVLQNLQKDQYQYPIKSFIREVASNATDALNEKRVARSILTGESRVEDHFVTGDSALVKDSKFDPDYYDLGWLDKNDKVKITYLERPSQERDLIIIEDTGVGLGGKRLQGYFKLSYSSKRLNKSSLGKFGINGAPFQKC